MSAADSTPASSPRPAAAVAITGWGLVSPLGNSAWDTFAALLAGRTTADRLTKLEPDLSAIDVVKAVGGVNIARHAGDPAIELAERACREALFMADAARPEPIDPSRTVYLMGSSKGAVHALAAAAETLGGGPDRRGSRAFRLGPPPVKDAALAVALGPHGYLSHHLCRRLGVTSIRQTVAACASSLIALHQGRQLLTTGPVEDRPHRVVVLTSEAALLEVFVASYQRLGVLPPLTADAAGKFHYRSHPLDEGRQGFLLAEMGAAVVLEPVQRNQPTKPGTLLLADTAHASDSYDLIRPAPGMPALSHLAGQLLAGRRIDLLHAHATGTPEHDPAELAAYAPHLTHGATDVYAVKGALGHGLGSAGLVSTILACLCAKTKRRPPMPWLHQPITPPSSNMSITSAATPSSDLSTHAIFAAGFGGHAAGAVVERIL